MATTEVRKEKAAPVVIELPQGSERIIMRFKCKVLPEGIPMVAPQERERTSKAPSGEMLFRDERYVGIEDLVRRLMSSGWTLIDWHGRIFGDENYAHFTWELFTDRMTPEGATRALHEIVTGVAFDYVSAWVNPDGTMPIKLVGPMRQAPKAVLTI